MNIDLKNNNILVTGASRGIGRGIAEALGGSGARVAVHYHKNKEAAEKVAKTIGNKSKTFRADLHNPKACEKLMGDVIKRIR